MLFRSGWNGDCGYIVRVVDLAELLRHHGVEPDNGYCVMGPCKGKRLRAIPLTEHNQIISIDISAIS